MPVARTSPRSSRAPLWLAPWLAWALSGLAAASTAGNATLQIATSSGAFGEPWTLALLGDLAFLMLPAVGLIIAVRRPQLIFGWLLLAAAFGFGIGDLAHNYATQALTKPGTLPGGMAAAWLQTLQVLGFVALPFLLLLFPDGRLLSAHWKPLGWAAIVCTLLLGLALVLSPSLMIDAVPSSRNPLGLAALEGINLVDPLFDAWYAILLLAVASLLLRFRRAQGEQRQQLKWVVFGGTLVPISFLVEAFHNPVLNAATDALAVMTFCGAIAIAILKYHLYDIDRLINRTMVYAALTALLGAVYAGVVLLSEQLFGRVGGDPPPWAVAGATLASAALFQPARRRIQAEVDRRFNRRRYDATRTIEAFSARLRDEVDLDTLSVELLAVADQTMQPTTASLWLRPALQARSRGQ